MVTLPQPTTRVTLATYTRSKTIRSRQASIAKTEVFW
jgi:hypothetical protein